MLEHTCRHSQEHKQNWNSCKKKTPNTLELSFLPLFSFSGVGAECGCRCSSFGRFIRQPLKLQMWTTAWFECHCYREIMLILCLLQFYLFFFFAEAYSLPTETRHPPASAPGFTTMPVHFGFTKYWTKLSRQLSRVLPWDSKTCFPAWVEANTDQFCYMSVFWNSDGKVLFVNVMKSW